MVRISGFDGDYQGLSEQEVLAGQLEYGKNELVQEKKSHFLFRMLSIFKEPMFLLLFCTALLYFFLGEPRDGAVMLCFVVFMAAINLFHEWRTDKTLQALRDLAAPSVRVIRNGTVESVNSTELTVGDLVILEEGERIPADGEIVEMHDLGVNESTLTGESDVVWKRRGQDEQEDAYWKRGTCYAGTTVTQGRAIVKVVAVGRSTEYGKIEQDIFSVPQQRAPLEEQTRRLVRVCAWIGFGLFVMVFLVTYIHSEGFVQSLLSGITLAMAMIPEEFPVILTVFLAMGAWRLALKNSLVRRMPAIETLGSVSVLCVDKTGTLTKNEMTVQEVYPHKGTSVKDLMSWAAMACEPEPYDPMEKAILEHAEASGINKSEIFGKSLLHEYSFSSESKMMGHVWDIDGLPALAAKGSPESILPLCPLPPEEAELIQNQQEALAMRGYRVIAVARKMDLPSIPHELKENELEFLGLIGFADPPREAVPDAMKVCARAGVRVVMITGDNGVTARFIAEKIGLKNSQNVVTGYELEKMNDKELREKVKETNIFARVIPRHKMRIVKALKDTGEIVAMTGDGVNDAPALKLADIGIAMGKRGTEVAKEAADMILLDDNFTTIVDTIKDGRRIYDNIKKAVEYVFVIHIPIALAALLAPLFHLPLLLLPIHIVLLELIIDPTCSIVFERQPAEPDIMDKKPRSPKDPLVNAGLVVKAALQGLAVFAAAFGSYVYLVNQGSPVELARTYALVILGFADLFLVYVNQSEKASALAGISRLHDKIVWCVNLGILVALALIVYWPAANSAVKTAPLSPWHLVTATGLAAVATCWWEIVKPFKARTGLVGNKRA